MVNWDSYDYDEVGNETLTIDGDGATTSDGYDGGNLTLEVTIDGSGNTINYESFTYDELGNATLTSNADGVTTMGYDGDNLTLQVVTGGGSTLSYESWSYNEAGQRP